MGQQSIVRKRVSGVGLFEQIGCSYYVVCVSREVLKWQKPSDSIL